MVIGGWPSEAMRFLTGAPTYTYDTEDYTSSEIWDMVKTADSIDLIITATTSSDYTDGSTNAVGLTYSHAFSIIGVVTLYNSDGTTKAQLFRMRNPWGSDGDYNGTWSDNDSVWTTSGETYIEQADFRNASDGIFFI